MSGSDLAPFVAAVLRDEVVDELIKENNELKSRQFLVQITGTNGTPIHYVTTFKHAIRSSADDIGDSPLIHVCFVDGSSHDLTTDGLPLSSLNIEIRLGGVVVQRFNIDDMSILFLPDPYDEESRMKEITLQYNINRRHLYGPIANVFGKIGPLPLGWQQGQVPANGLMSLTDLLEHVADENNDLTPQTLIIKALTFREKDITGLMSFIKK